MRDSGSKLDEFNLDNHGHLQGLAANIVLAFLYVGVIF